MYDTILAIIGKHRCGWCIDREDSWVSKNIFGSYKHHYQQNKIQQWYWVTLLPFIDEHVPVWKLGQWWHFKYHKKEINGTSV